MTGTIEKMIAAEGVGVICGDDGQEYLLHHLEVTDGSSFTELRPGVPVRFGVASGPKGPRAEDVRVAR